MVQIHIDVDCGFYERFKKALKKTDWRTISEFFRANMRQLLIEAESLPEKRVESRKEHPPDSIDRHNPG